MRHYGAADNRAYHDEPLDRSIMLVRIVASRHFRDPMSGAAPPRGDLEAMCDSEFEREVFRRLIKRGFKSPLKSARSDMGVQLPTVEKILNHISGSFGGVKGVYQHHDFADEKRSALDMWARHLPHGQGPLDRWSTRQQMLRRLR